MRILAVKPTIDSIADLAGVSKATVSAIISGGGSNVRASDATRRKVFAIAQRLNYRPPTTHRIGVIHAVGHKDPDEIDWVEWISPMLASIHSEAIAADKLISVFAHSSLPSQRRLPAGLPPIFKRKHIDGVIVSGVFDEALLSHIEVNRLPYVLMNVHSSDTHSQNSVSFDEVFTGWQAARHLLELGHRRILYAGVEWSGRHYSVVQRREGYEKAMREADLAPTVLPHKENESFIAGLTALLRGGDRPTAVIAYNEVVAFCCCRALMGLGMSFRDVSLLTVTWEDQGPMANLGISCVCLPARQMGTLAFRTLQSVIETGEPASAVLLRGVIRPRLSTCPNPGGE